MTWNLIRMALSAIFSNPLRSSLTALGIIIGAASVIAIGSLGAGARARLQNELASFGQNLLWISPDWSLLRSGVGSPPKFKLDDVRAIQGVPGIRRAAPRAQRGAQAVFGGATLTTMVFGTTLEGIEMSNNEVISGTTLTDADMAGGAAACLVGKDLADKVFGEVSPIGQTLRLDRASCQVVGLLKARGTALFGADRDNQVILPLATFQRRIAGNNDFTLITAELQPGAQADRVVDAVHQVLRDNRRLAPDRPSGFQIQSSEEASRDIDRVIGGITGVLGLIAAISLLVGGIGIMNIMLVSVTERTREIGIRLAIGALQRDVLQQFLIEAVVLSVLGGLIGLVLGLALSWAATSLMNIPFVLNIPVILLTLVFSALVGVVFGYFPARRAARQDPIVALRYE